MAHVWPRSVTRGHVGASKERAAERRHPSSLISKSWVTPLDAELDLLHAASLNYSQVLVRRVLRKARLG
jgi:hypothetical protein